MAFFKFPWTGQKDEGERSPRRSRTAQAESIDEMRRRARYRLIGAAVLVAVGVVGFPLLFDTQPRPIPVDVPIEIPDRNQVAPMMVPGSGASSATAVAAADGAKLKAEESLAAGEEVFTPAPLPAVIPPEPRLVAKPEPKPEPKKAEAKPELKPEVKADAKLEPKPAPKPEAKPEPKPEPKKAEAKPEPKSSSDEAARARALLEGRTPTAASAPAAAQGDEGRFIVQVGAFGDTAKAQEVRGKLERAGFKTYTQAVDTKDGKRTRVRVGPFGSRAEADKAAGRVKGLGLPASVLTL